jgi:thioredoxin-dependent peroxiredoxin
LAAGPKINTGDVAPDFELPTAEGEIIRLADFRGKAEVVLYFYPKDDTPGCTAEACAFRDSFEAFRDAGAEVIGVSGDSAESHSKFAARHRLPFRLVSDADGSIRARYGVPKTLGLLPGRVTYLIDRQGFVRHVFSSQFRPARHIAEALRVLKELRGS